MNELERHIAAVIGRLEDGPDPSEEPDFELKSEYPDQDDEAESVWWLADLVASLANDVHLEGLRSLVVGPQSNLTRPAWLKDEAVLRDKLLRHFEGAVSPRVELLRREVANRGEIDLFVIVERSEPPYVTRHRPGGFWVVRLRTNTARRTATRAELVALARGARRVGAPVRKIDAKVSDYGSSKSMRLLVVTNVGTVPVTDVTASIPEDADARFTDVGEDGFLFERLDPGEKNGTPLIVRSGMGQRVQSFRISVEAQAEDGEPVRAEALVSPYL